LAIGLEKEWGCFLGAYTGQSTQAGGELGHAEGDKAETQGEHRWVQGLRAQRERFKQSQ
jgi:hypothetical protein